MAARLKAIILDQLVDGEYRVCLWADVPVDRQRFYAVIGAVSAWLDATAEDVGLLVSGEVAERVITLRLAPAEAKEAARGGAEKEAAIWQDHVNVYDPWSRYGSAFDGQGWKDGGK